MKRYFGVIAVLFLAVTMTWSMPGLTVAEDEAVVKEAAGGFSISRLVICAAVDNREPVGATDTFSASTEEVFCFIEASDIVEDTQIAVVWSLGENELARVNLPLKKSARFRTYSSKKLAGLKGEWKVEVLDAQGKSVKEVSFTVK